MWWQSASAHPQRESPAVAASFVYVSMKQVEVPPSARLPRATLRVCLSLYARRAECARGEQATR